MSNNITFEQCVEIWEYFNTKRNSMGEKYIPIDKLHALKMICIKFDLPKQTDREQWLNDYWNKYEKEILVKQPVKKKRELILS